ncbi:MAG TPA: hypothetical protein VF133_18290 [Terriglobales bacterium]
MTRDEAAAVIIESMNYAADRETDSPLYDSDKNRLWGSEHYNSGRIVVRPSPWAEGNFEKKMAALLVWANWLNSSSPEFADAQQALAHENSILGRVIRRAKRQLWLRRFEITRR